MIKLLRSIWCWFVGCNVAVESVIHGRNLSPAYAPGTDVPTPLTGEWATYNGARPELRGAPKNTVLLAKGIDKVSPEARARLLDVAGDSNIPVDSLATVISNESGWNPKAVFKHEGKPFAVGLFQLTRGANLQGFTSTEALARVLEMPAEQQIEEVLRPYLLRFKVQNPPSPGQFYMMNFLPDHASKPDDFVIAKKDETNAEGRPTFASKVYSMNPGFDPGGARGFFTVGDVKSVARAKTRGAAGRRISVDGVVMASRAEKELVELAKEMPKTAPTAHVPSGVRRMEDSAGGLLLNAAMAGEMLYPQWTRVFVGELEVEVTTDALMAHVPIMLDGAVVHRPLRLPVTYRETIAIAKKLEAVAPNVDIWDQTWRVAAKIRPIPLPAGPLQGSVGYTLKHSTEIDAMGAAPGELWRDVGKGWIVHPQLAVSGAVNYGWKVTRETKLGDVVKNFGDPIQTVGTKHNELHFDYSQTCVLVRRQARYQGKPIDLLDYYAQSGIDRRFLNVY